MSRSTGPLLHRTARSALPLALALGLLAACSGNEELGATATTSAAAPTSSAAETQSESTAPTSAGSAAIQTITATEVNFAISLSEDDLTAGTYEIDVVNDGDATHDLVVEQAGNDLARSETLQPGTDGNVTVTLEPGEYVFYCSVGNHRDMGMELPVTVR